MNKALKIYNLSLLIITIILSQFILTTPRLNKYVKPPTFEWKQTTNKQIPTHMYRSLQKEE